MLTALALSLLLVQSADTFEVRETMIADEKAVFATVESINTVPARARIGGTIGELLVDEGDMVEAGLREDSPVEQILRPAQV